jgi:hypothetical protein
MRSILGISLGAALAGLITRGGAGAALAQGNVTNMDSSGYRAGRAAAAHRNAAQPGPAMKGYRPAPLKKGHMYRPGPRAKGYGYRAAPRLNGYSYRPAPQVQRRFYRAAPRLKGHAYRPARRARGYRSAVVPKTCGQFKYWSTAKGRCLDARTSPPALK